MPVITDHEDKFYNNPMDLGTKYVETEVTIGKLDMGEYMFVAYSHLEGAWESEFEDADEYLGGEYLDRTSVIVTFSRNEHDRSVLTMVAFVRPLHAPIQKVEEVRNPISTP